MSKIKKFDIVFVEQIRVLIFVGDKLKGNGAGHFIEFIK